MTTSTVAHSVPGRMRVRVMGTQAERRKAVRAAERELGDRAEVQSDERTGSLLITYPPEELDPATIVDLLREADSTFAALVPPSLEEAVRRPISTVAQGIENRFTSANRSVLDATAGHVDLRVLFPIALSGLAMRQLAREGVGLRSVPWYVLAYYAFDSYVKLHVTNVRDQR